MKRIASVATIVMLMVATALMPSVSASPVFKIGGLASLQSGYGQSMVSGAGLAIEEINAAGGVNGIKFEIDWQDTEANASIGRTATQKLVYGSKVDAILGCHASTVILATESLIKNAGILQIAMGSATAVTELGNPWIARVREPDELTAQVLANYIVDVKKCDKIAIFYMSEQYGVGGKDNMVAALKAKNIEPLISVAHNPKDKDFSSQLLSIKKSGAKAMVVFSGLPDLGILVRQARQLCPDVDIFMSSVGATKPFMDVAGPAADGTFAVVTFTEDNPNPKVQEFVEKHKAKYGEPPYDFFDPLAYDAVYMLAEAVKNAGSTDHKKVRDAFMQIKGFDGATGLTYDVTPDGETVHELLLVMIENGRHKVIQKVRG
ncbi:MAG: ABC transporter substrate-binding protein [Firmicutes bacterium]|nr:ABC transporter substrate-binding protein [Bacillota bacterium]